MRTTKFGIETDSLPDPRESWDVVVLGGGPAGCAAAIAAAECGARVRLIERTTMLGGMGTAGKVPAWCPFSDREKQIHGGLAARIFTASKATTPHVAPDRLDWVPIADEALKRIYDDAVTGAGAEVRFETLLVDVVRDDHGGVAAVLCADKTGLVVNQARVFIDTTGDADLVARTGVPIHHGDDQGGELMPSTMCFVLANVMGYPDRRMPPLRTSVDGRPSVWQQIRADPRFAAIPDDHLCMGWTGPGCVGFNAGHVYRVDNTDPASVSRGVMEGRRLAQVYRDALATHVPDMFGASYLVSTGSLLGVRETRRIIADYELTVADYLARRSFPDEICRNAYFIDRHLLSSEQSGIGDWEKRVHARFEKYQPGESHGIPYRCLCPQGLRNVLVAGRCIGTDRTVNGSVRVMPVCLNTGEAAGVAATMVAADADIHRVDPGALRHKLKERGAYLP